MTKEHSWTGRPCETAAEEAAEVRRSGWRSPAPPYEGVGKRLWRPALVATLLFGAVATFIVVLHWFQPPPPARLLLVGAGYEDNLQLPPNPSGRLALDRLAQMAVNSAPWSTLLSRPGRMFLQEGVFEFHGGDHWASSLARCSEPVAIVFWAVHAGADSDGAFLLPSQAGPAPAERVRLETILQQLAAMPSQTRKLLIIDASQLDDDWALGMLRNDFVRAVIAMDGQIAAIPNLAVMLSAGIDQRCWNMGLAETSVFSHFLIETLVRGPWEGRNSSFNAHHLYEEVRYRVQQWVAKYRHAEQTPLLLPRKDGVARARAIPLMFRLHAVPTPEWTDPLPAIAAAWDRYADLQREAPHSRVRTPHLWSRLEAFLVRHEQLLLGGERAAAEGIREQTLRTEGDIRETQVLPLESIAVTLTMPALAGGTWRAQAEFCASFEKLWAAQPDEQPAIWLKMQRGQEPDAFDPVPLQRRVLALAVQRAAKAPEQNLARAAKLVRLVHDGVMTVAPAEAHFLLMLDRYLPTPITQQRSALIGRALRIRLLAEQAALSLEPGGVTCPEYVLPWTRDTIAAADALRRPGEDLLFGTEADDLAEASRLLNRSETLYRQALADGKTAGFVLRQSDEAAYELMHYSKWAAASPRDVLEKAGAMIVATWEQVHALEQLIPTEPTQASLAELKKRAKQIEDGRRRLRSLLDGCIAAARQPDADDLVSVLALLEVPFIPVPIRMDLVKKRLQLEKRALDGVETSTPKAAGDDQQESLLRTRVRGEMALAALGPRRSDLGGGGGQESLESLLHTIQTFSTQPDWQPLLLAAEASIGDRWRRVTDESKSLARAATRQSDPKQVTWLLMDADRLARRSLAVDASVEGARMLRSWLVAEALLFQASRVHADHWEDERPGAVPYYRTATKSLLRDARILCEKKLLTTERITRLAAQIDKEESLDVQVTSRVDLSPGDTARLSIGIARTSSWRVRGFPLAWAEVAAGSQEPDAVKMTPLSPGQRAVMATVRADTADGRNGSGSENGGENAISGDSSGEGPIPLQISVTSPLLERLESSPPASPTPLSARIDWSVFHRGALVRRTTELMLYPRAELASDWQKPPSRAAIAIAAEEPMLRRMAQARGAMTIVLDCTGSMGPLGKEASEAPTRFQSVLAAFRELLRGIPVGSTVSVWVFGQAVGDAKTVEQPESTIMRLVDPVVWSGEPAQVREVVARAERLVPWNESPILRAMLAAREDLIRADGARTMILLTDGIDNRFARDKELNPTGQSVPDALLQWFRGTGILVHVIGFQVANHEDEEAHRQFGVVAGLDPPGTFSTVDEVEELLDSVRRVGRPMLQYRQVWRDAARQAEPSALTGVVGIASGPLRWTAIPLEDRRRSFSLELIAGPPVAGEAAVSPGDALGLCLTPRGGALALERVPFATQFAVPANRLLKDKGWMASIANYALTDSGALRLLMALEPQAGGTEEPVQIHQPTDLWLELAPADGRTPAVFWRQMAGYPAAVWTIESPAWPLDADGAPCAAQLRIWWLSGRRANPAVSLRRDVDFRTAASIPRRLRVEGDDIVIESVSVESRSLASTAAVSRAAAPRWCIVVRVSHPPNRAVRASLEGIEPFDAEEHRHYLAAGRYVGIFLPTGANDRVDLEQCLASDLRGLQITSLSAMRQEAEASGHYVEFASLGVPPTAGAFLAPPVLIE